MVSFTSISRSRQLTRSQAVYYTSMWCIKHLFTRNLLATLLATSLYSQRCSARKSAHCHDLLATLLATTVCCHGLLLRPAATVVAVRSRVTSRAVVEHGSKQSYDLRAGRRSKQSCEQTVVVLSRRWQQTVWQQTVWQQINFILSVRLADRLFTFSLPRFYASSSPSNSHSTLSLYPRILSLRRAFSLRRALSPPCFLSSPYSLFAVLSLRRTPCRALSSPCSLRRTLSSPYSLFAVLSLRRTLSSLCSLRRTHRRALPSPYSLRRALPSPYSLRRAVLAN